MTIAETTELIPAVVLTGIDSIKAKGAQIAALYEAFDPTNSEQSEQIASLQRELAELRTTEVAKAQLATITAALSFVLPRGDAMHKVAEQMRTHKINAFSISVTLGEGENAMPLASLTLGKAVKASTGVAAGTRTGTNGVNWADIARRNALEVGGNSAHRVVFDKARQVHDDIAHENCPYA